LKATKHRVLDIGSERYSCPFFFEPHYKAKIPVDLKNMEGETVIYGDWLLEKIQEFGEYKHFKPKELKKQDE